MTFVVAVAHRDFALLATDTRGIAKGGVVTDELTKVSQLPHGFVASVPHYPWGVLACAALQATDGTTEAMLAATRRWARDAIRELEAENPEAAQIVRARQGTYVIGAEPGKRVYAGCWNWSGEGGGLAPLGHAVVAAPTELASVVADLQSEYEQRLARIVADCAAAGRSLTDTLQEALRATAELLEVAAQQSDRVGPFVEGGVMLRTGPQTYVPMRLGRVEQAEILRMARPETLLVETSAAASLSSAVAAPAPEFLADAAYRQNPKLMTEWFQAFVETGRPPLIDFVNIDGLPVPVWENPLALTAAEQLANREFYFDRPIVPRGEEERAPEEQFNEYTSRAAILLGDVFKTSPRRIDHAMQGIFGPVSRDLVEVLGVGPKAPDREPKDPWWTEPSEWWVVGRLFQRGGALGTRPKSVNEMYDLLEKATQLQRSTRRVETARERQLRLQLTDAQRAVTALLYVRQYTPTSSQRRRLTAETADIARAAVAAYRAGELHRGEFATERRRREAQRERVAPRQGERPSDGGGLSGPRPPQPPRPPGPQRR